MEKRFKTERVANSNQSFPGETDNSENGIEGEPANKCA